MNNPRPTLWRRLCRRGMPLLAARLVLGLLFIWMGLTKTGLVKVVLDKTGLRQTATVKKMVAGGVIELSNPVDFLKLIREYKIVPEDMPVLMNLVAAVLPWVEVLCGLLLIAGVALRGVALMFLVLLTMFTVMVTARAIGIYHAGDIAFCAIKFDCGCGSGEVYICRKIPENITLWCLSLYVLLSRNGSFCCKRELIPRRPTTNSTRW